MIATIAGTYTEYNVDIHRTSTTVLEMLDTHQQQVAAFFRHLTAASDRNNRQAFAPFFRTNSMAASLPHVLR